MGTRYGCGFDYLYYVVFRFWVADNLPDCLFFEGSQAFGAG